MDLENIMLSEVSRAQNDKYCVNIFSHSYEIPKNKAQTQKAQWWLPGINEWAVA